VLLSYSTRINQSSMTYISAYGDNSIILSNKKGQKLLLSNSYAIDKYCNNFYVDKIDYYLSFDELKQKDVDDLKKYGTNRFYSTSVDISIDEATKVESGEEEFVGAYSFNYLAKDDKILGVSICFDDIKVFVAKEFKLNYNDYCKQYLDEFKPDFVVLDDKNSEVGNDYYSVSQTKNQYTKYCYEELGNFSIEFGKILSVRGIDWKH